MLAFRSVSAEPAIVEPKAPLAGRFRFLRAVSPGSWIAWDERSDRRVLVALVIADDAFRLEAARAVEHPHLAQILQVQHVVPEDELPSGCEVDRAAVVAELAHGRTLSALVHADGRLTPARAVAWTLRLARGLSVLHGSGAFHQAISPAAVVQRAAGRPVSPVLTWLRALPYGPALSPEILSGQEPGGADDVWSLCVTLYFALTGVHPFEGQSSGELLESMQRAAPTLSQHGVEDPALQKVFDAAFTRDAARRFRSADELVAALEAYELEQPLPPRSFGARPPRLGLGLTGGRSLTAGLNKPGPLHKSLEGVVFDVSALENPELRDLGPEPVSAGRASAEPPVPVPAALAGGDRPSFPQPQRRPPSLPPINPFRKKKARWPLLAVLLGAAGAGAAFGLRPKPSPAPEPAPVTAINQATQPAPAPKPKLSKSERLRLCTESYFEEATFEPDATFDFVCQDGPLDGVARQLHELAEAKTDARLAQQADELPTNPTDDVVRGDVRASRVRRPLGWYELLATAIIRRSCCSPAPPAQLPKTQGWCAQLGDVVEDLAEDSARSADLAPRVKRFDRAVDCLYANRTTIPYEDYAARPLDEPQRSALQNFLSLAAMSEAKRRKLE